MRPRRSVSLVFLTLGVSAAACAQTSDEAERFERLFAAKRTELLYLTAIDSTRLDVEVDVVAGGETTAKSIVADLHEQLELLCAKPDGIYLRRTTSIPESATRGRQRESVALEQMDGPLGDPGEGTSYLYILVDDSERSGIRTYNPQVRAEYRSAIFYDDAYVRNAARELAAATDGNYVHWYDELRRETLLHELGHCLGLVSNAAHGAENHCTDATCRSAQVLTPSSLGGWCERCNADLEASRARTDSQPVRFHGPLLVHSGDGYWSVNLPGYLEVRLGSPFAEDWRVVRDRALADFAESGGGGLEDVRLQLLFDAPEGVDPEDGLRAALDDADPLVQGLARDALAALERSGG